MENLQILMIANAAIRVEANIFLLPLLVQPILRPLVQIALFDWNGTANAHVHFR
jgi:hypothetical protein